MIRVEAPDGTVIEFPAGTDDATIDRVMRENFAPKPKVPLGRAVMQGLGQGVSAGFMDEAVGLAGGSTEAMRGELEQARADRPIATYGAELIASMLPGAAAVRGVQAAGKTVGKGAQSVVDALTKPAQGWLGRAGQGAAAGAAGGAIYGAGQDEGGVLDRIDGATLGAGVGAGVGAAVPAVLAGAGAVTAPVRNMVGGALGVGNANRANRAIATGLQRSGRTMDDVTADMAAAAAAGQPEFVLADALGHSGQRMLAGQARRPGDMRQEIVDFLEARQAGQGRRIGGELAGQLAPQGRVPAATTAGGVLNQTGPTVTGAQLGDNLTTARGAAADVAYTAARSNAAPVDVRGAVAAIDDRIGPMQSGGAITGDGIDATLDRFRRRLIDDSGNATIELSDFDRVLGVKQDLGDAIGKAQRAGESNKARELLKVQRALDEALEAASPDYRAANDEFAAASRVIDAIPEGAAATSNRVRAADTAQQIAAMTPEQRAAYGVGYGDRLLGQIENAPPGVNKARNLADDKVLGDLDALAADPKRLRDFLGRENTMFETRRQAVGGSQTADNLADNAEASGYDMSAIANLLTGNFRTGSQQLLTAAGQAASGQNEATRQIIAQALLSRDPQAVLTKALQQTTDDASRKAIIEALVSRSISRPTISQLQ